MNHTSRVILLIDMDCFYCQVEENLNPLFKGKPLAVVQYNQWRGGGIIAVNYPARDKGVTRHMRGEDAKKKCPEIILAKVPQVRGKADLSKYRDAGKRVADVLQIFTPLLERASVDEAYLDITEAVEKRINDKTHKITPEMLPNTFVVGHSTADFVENVNSNREFSESNLKLVMGGVIAEEIRSEVFKVTGYRCSAGIAHNKILAKLVCGLHKPDKQTILPQEAVSELYEKLPIGKIKSLGGKFGNIVAEKLNIEYIGELVKFSRPELAKKFDEKAASWLYNIARGIDMEPVNTRLVSKSIGCCKRFPGKTALLTAEDVEHWLNELAEEIAERLEKDFEENSRRPKQMVVSFDQKLNQEEISSTRTHPLNSYEKEKIFENALKVIQKNCLKADGSYIITFLGISVGNFQDVKKVKEITSFFQNMRNNNKKEKDDLENSKVSLLSNGTNLHCQVKETECDTFKVNNSFITTEKGNESEPRSPTSLIYSNSTDEDNAGCTSYIYYDEVFPDSVMDQSFIDGNEDSKPNENTSTTSEDSISEEFAGALSGLKAEREMPRTHSFFTKYFDNKVSRNFNTSKVLVSVEPSELDSSGNGDEDSASSDVAVKLDDVCDKKICDTLGIGSETFENLTEVGSNGSKTPCPKCRKVISCFEYQSHMDYHFALDIVKNEAHLYKPESNERTSTSPSTSKSTKGGEKPKRKQNEVVKSKTIARYFQNNAKEVVGENGRCCTECNKIIHLDDWDVHVDFHAAKKLHLEMNSLPEPPSNLKIKGPLKNPRGHKNIMGFLKRT